MSSLYFKTWPVKQAKAVVMLIHGLAEHCNRYQALAKHLNTTGYTLASMDLPGHGQSPGRRGHITQFEEFSSASLALYQRIQIEYPNLPIFLLGHSMGGLICTHFLLKHQSKFKGAMLSGAALASPQAPPAWQVPIARCIARALPTFGMVRLDATAISRNKKVIADYQNDPLVYHGALSVRLSLELFDTMHLCLSSAHNITLPLLIMHGENDTLTAPQGSQQLYDSVSSSDKTLRMYPDLLHEIFNEPEAPTVFQELSTWLDSRLQQL